MLLAITSIPCKMILLFFIQQYYSLYSHYPVSLSFSTILHSFWLYRLIFTLHSTILHFYHYSPLSFSTILLSLYPYLLIPIFFHNNTPLLSTLSPYISYSIHKTLFNLPLVYQTFFTIETHLFA